MEETITGRRRERKAPRTRMGIRMTRTLGTGKPRGGGGYKGSTEKRGKGRYGKEETERITGTPMGDVAEGVRDGNPRAKNTDEG